MGWNFTEFSDIVNHLAAGEWKEVADSISNLYDRQNKVTSKTISDNTQLIQTKSSGIGQVIGNSVARFDGSDGISIKTSDIYLTDAANIGIGTQLPLTKLDIRNPGVATPQIHLSYMDDDSGAYLISSGGSNIFLLGGATIDGSTFIAKSTEANIIGGQFGIFEFIGDTSLTPGSIYSPTENFRIGYADIALSTVAPTAIGNATYNRLALPAIGAAAPTFTTRSNGAKVILFPLLSGSTVDGAIGVEVNAIWFSTFGNSSTYLFKWYGGTTEVMRLQGDGELLIKAGGALGFAKVGGVVQGTDHYTDVNNSTTTETDLYSDTIAANALNSNGDKLATTYQVQCTGAALASQDMRIYFGGTKIYDSGALSIGAITSNFTFEVLVVRVSASVARCSVAVSSDFATLFPYSAYTEVTGLTLANSQILKITGQASGASGASNQITAKLSSGIMWYPES